MTLIFFQNCISPHQIPYIREFIKDDRIDSVILCAPRIDYQVRKNMGWNSEHFLNEPNIRFFIEPSDEETRNLLKSSPDVICLFSGIRADADIYRWFKMSLTEKVSRYLITERPNMLHKPRWMHFFRFLLRDYKYVKRISGIFGMGQEAVDYYNTISCKWKTFPFMYVTEMPDYHPVACSENLRILYVGSLNVGKNVNVVIKALKGILGIVFTIVGDGPEKSNLEIQSRECGVNVSFEGYVSLGKVSDYMQANDVLILPSLYDGWGAVVNEALSNGMYVIASDKCGSMDLLQNSEIGCVFKSNNANELRSVFIDIVLHRELVQSQRLQRHKWAEKSISGPVIAKYMINCLDKGKADCPWK